MTHLLDEYFWRNEKRWSGALSEVAAQRNSYAYLLDRLRVSMSAEQWNDMIGPLNLKADLIARLPDYLKPGPK